MEEKDLPTVAEVEAGVFTDWYRVYRRQPEPLAERSLEELRYACSHDPGGNHVAVAADGALVGFVMARTWGSVGWFGTLGVPTQFQGMGIGKALVESAVRYLRGRCSVIGLETMPESGANIGLYTRAGFVASYPTHIMELSLIQEAGRLGGMTPEEVRAWSGLGAIARSSALGSIREISDALLPGLDYCREVKAVHEHGVGRTLLAHGPGGRLDGFAVLRTAPFRKEDTSGRAFVHALGVRPGAVSEAVLESLLRQIWSTATTLGMSRVAAGVNGRNHLAAGMLIDAGFRIIRSAIRMVMLPTAGEILTLTDDIEASRWAG
jgi:ribosomal protein S18 acetylase RimI-like enzyme